MFDGETTGDGTTTECGTSTTTETRGGRRATSDWREVDRQLRAIANKRAVLDGEEARWLREAERVRIWEHAGFCSMRAYLENVFGYGPHAAQDRLRVARELETLPVLTEALTTGALCYTAIKELTRVATAATERAWLDAAQGKATSDVEVLVAGHHTGDDPTTPVNPEELLMKLVLALRPETYARLREAHARLNEEGGEYLEFDRLISVLCERTMAGGAGDAEPRRAKFQIALTVCPTCKAGTQAGGGLVVPVAPSTVARAECDAQRMGAFDPETGKLARNVQDIPPKTRAYVLKRDRGRCQAPGCRSAINLEVHHICALADGGSHHPSNLTTLCDGCHLRHHRGALRITGTAPDHLGFERLCAGPAAIEPARDEVFPNEPPTGCALALATIREDVKTALTTAGYQRGEAAKAAAYAVATVPPREATLETCMRAALRSLLSRNG
jgi:hypothetical protein